MRHLVAPSPGVRQCVSSSCNSHTPGFHTSLLHPFSGRMYLYAAKTPASLHRPVGLCLLSISAEELLVNVGRGRLRSTNYAHFGSYPPETPSLSTHSPGTLVSRATRVHPTSCVQAATTTIPVLHTSPTKTKASNHAAKSICGVRAAKVVRGPGEKVGVQPRSARRGLGVPTCSYAVDDVYRVPPFPPLPHAVPAPCRPAVPPRLAAAKRVFGTPVLVLV